MVYTDEMINFRTGRRKAYSPFLCTKNTVLLCKKNAVLWWHFQSAVTWMPQPQISSIRKCTASHRTVILYTSWHFQTFPIVNWVLYRVKNVTFHKQRHVGKYLLLSDEHTLFLAIWRKFLAQNFYMSYCLIRW